MDEAEVARVYEQCRSRARRLRPADPAVDEDDVLQSAWAKVTREMDSLLGELDRVRFLMRAVNQVAIDHHRRVARRPAAPLEEWQPSGVNVEAEAIARASLGAIVALVLAGDVFAAAVLAYALCGGAAGATMLGWPQSTFNTRVWRFRHERAGLGS